MEVAAWNKEDCKSASVQTVSVEIGQSVSPLQANPILKNYLKKTKPNTKFLHESGGSELLV